MQNVLDKAIDIIVKNFAPDKIILFGSRATGMERALSNLKKQRLVKDRSQNYF